MSFKSHFVLGLLAVAALSSCSEAPPRSAVNPPKNTQAVSGLNPDTDTRMIVSLTPEQRLHVLNEMNQFLLSTQEIVEGIATEDDELVRSAVAASLARPGNGPRQGQGLMRGALPPEFRQMGSAMKTELAKISALSEEDAGETVLLEQLSSVLIYCQSCHASYQIRVSE